LLPRLVRFQIYQAFLESLAAENLSRMVAMHSATQNAGDIIEDLTLSYNKARQETITSELTDIIGGTSFLGGERG
jgi:F-type H+-transporting ATPase subunit gamma